MRCAYRSVLLTIFLHVNGFIVLALAIAIILAASYGLCYKLMFNVQSYKDVDDTLDVKYLQKNVVRNWLPLLLIAPAFTQIFPLIFIAGQLDFNEESNTFLQVIIFLALSVAMIIVGIFPGMILINEKKNKNLLQIIIYTLIIIPVSMLVLTMIFRPTPI